jgi:hypothetical protein
MNFKEGGTYNYTLCFKELTRCDPEDLVTEGFTFTFISSFRILFN